jgi:hypothetical protein
MDKKTKLKGLEGWLVLVGLNVVLSPIVLLLLTVSYYTLIFEDESWELLTTVDSGFYNPHWAIFTIMEIIHSSILFVAFIYLIYLFFSRHYYFPRFYIVTSLIPLIYIPLDAWFVTTYMPSEAMLIYDTIDLFSQTAVSTVIWVPYILISQRVKVTFVEGMSNKI